MKARILSHEEVSKWVHRYVRLDTMAAATLFAGDRLSCVDEGVAIDSNLGQEVGIATIAPKGEQSSGQPTIVAIFVRHEFRKGGYGKELMMVTIDRCRERNLVPAKIDALTTPAVRICEHLPDDYKADVRVFDMSMGGLMDMILLT